MSAESAESSLDQDNTASSVQVQVLFTANCCNHTNRVAYTYRLPVHLAQGAGPHGFVTENIMRNTGFVLSSLILAVSACSSSDPSPLGGGSGGTASISGGAVGNGGSVTGQGGIVSNGGSVQPTGGVATGGSSVTNGTGGSVATGGNASNGGSTSTGGQARGGVTSTGGAGAATGGKATGGGANNGGSTATGGKATTTTGGAPATGGTATAGGSTTGGSSAGGAVVGSCSRAVGACTAPTVQVTDVALASAVTTYDQGDTSVFPIMIASMPSGGSRLAWLGTDKTVHIGQLGCDDKLVGTPFTIPGIDLQDVIADDNGGVVLVTRNATNGGTDNCGTGTLCGGTSSPCRTMWMVRFNSAGTVEWETQVTNLSSSLAGYQNGARFIWWYQHHGRLAFSGTNYAAFFGVAITVNNGSCVDIHEGDRLQIVSSSGALVSSGSLEVGMSHAWTSRILWDSRTSKFQATDATDNNCRITNPVGAVTIAASTCDGGTLFNGDVVKSTAAGYWNAWSQGGTIRLAHFTTGAADSSSIASAGSSQHPHLVSLGANNMLLAWKSGTSVAAQVRSATDGATAGSQLTIAIGDHDFGAWKAYDDGSAAYAYAAGNSSTAKVARVMPCN